MNDEIKKKYEEVYKKALEIQNVGVALEVIEHLRKFEKEKETS